MTEAKHVHKLLGVQRATESGNHLKLQVLLLVISKMKPQFVLHLECENQ